MRVLAIDPGWGTGWAWYDTLTGEFESGEVTGFIECCEQLAYLLADPQLLEVVAETFVIDDRTVKLTQQTEALRLLGVLEWECSKRDFGYTLHSAKDPKKPKAKRILKALGWWVKTKDDHANSAAYHLYCYLSNRGMLVPEDKLKLIRMMDD